ncbi:MAG: sulfite exporter TauE/SafE family protein [Acidibacillus sp.]|uniref:Probable membrane transporter protein n=2 Tax=Sulfoacidibacillus ferrooxidans TaxID=2005001 RepID=A0A9X1V6U0_9BACL|nr:sulfite exporter TauE/SafE family protein [Sulfoacidibacillus ferrooxidans]MCI0182074.1 putative membrane transporter protein [Sulfoacidibacillus ferrooxidans]MCY0892448.1 sulfite exporter TauE/SafE family protein [Acidibacillus sp.]
MSMDLTPLQVVLAILSGGVVGFALGLIGGGGSILAVPLLLYVVGMHNAHLVIGTTALAVAINAYLNLIPHARAGNVRWKAAVSFAIPGAIGAYIGSTLGKDMDGKALLFLFAILMMVVAVIMLKPKKNVETDFTKDVDVKFSKVIPAGLIVGIVSGFFGIGGGFLIVPGLLFSTGMPMIWAIGSSLFSVGTFGLTTAVNYASSGLVDWMVVLEYVAGGIVGGILGTMLATRLSKSKRMLNYVFSGVIIVVAIYMLYVNFSAFHHL